MIWNVLVGIFGALVVLATILFVYLTCVRISEGGRGRWRRGG